MSRQDSRQDFSFASPEGPGKATIDIASYRWPTEGKPLGIVQISHGMGEHWLRYSDLAGFLNQAGFQVLSRDNAEVDKYIADPLCGFGVIAHSMATMAAASLCIIDPAQLARIRKDLPIWIMAGDKDPINHDLEWLRPVAERYRAAGIKDMTEKYYHDGRHEMFNETNRAEVYRDLLEWVRRAIRAT